MKIAKMTWLHNGNYGSVLQAVALQRFLKEKGYDVTDINYNASTSTKLINWVQNHNSPKLFIGKLKERKKYKSPEKFELRFKRFEQFKKDNLKMTELCRNPRDLKRVENNFDCFICGSDQIWSPALMNPVFYFSFLDDEKFKIAYAPSFGVTTTSNAKKERIGKLLSSFNYISIRETQGKSLIKDITGKDVPVQIDPTMLIDEKIWKEYAGNEPICNEEYIFCYLLTPNQKYLKCVEKFAKSKNMKVIIVPTMKGPFESGFEEVPEAGPSEWLNYIKNATYVFTDSFHGCIFSSIFHKDFILFKRFSDKEKASENSRVYTLTKLLNVENRLIGEENTENIYQLKDIDYKKVDDIIHVKAKESGVWLINAINESEKLNEK